ncbi:MAG: hypothetical protein A2X61_07350 [Ignavibacteria bacterium GWB2_35_12]|nr:MAG: hypothetical protein A2X63_08585 [Ignavibacteria bacterium GWA2_35_8]OGU39293.1 MAG: hypothetical protein A2X61_07350 [Ignavibacteria bacterium GWB2_35_12]OGU95935.1 MAG: hypothetical protein A2220_15075 [Ignavibacteria bacterium RIFOXYA2_FULL_35_10]OGV21176.1 MAG: hypothetical protein A2475_01450 [Ignavibacteria bacterium RIFOXYC2_FULL_35_21]
MWKTIIIIGNYKEKFMSDNIAKINLKIGQNEILIEGTSEFVSSQYEKIVSHLKIFKEIDSLKPIEPPKKDGENDGENPELKEPLDPNKLPDTFGEWLNKIPKETSDTDKAVLSGYFTQVKSENKYFRTRDVTKLLKDHSINLSNPSTFLKHAIKAKKIFQHSKSGTEANYKLEREAEIEMIQLLSGQKG